MRRPSEAFITEPLADLGSWTRHFLDAEVPVLSETAAAVESLRKIEDDVDANRIGEALSADPLMTLKVLAYASRHQGRRVVTDVETVTEALVMLGISPFFRAFDVQPTIDDWLGGRPEALKGLLTAMQRADHGANLALAFAIQRMDPDAATVHSVALLHDFANLLLWCHAPDLQLQVQSLRRADPALASRTAQEQVLRIAVADLQVELAREWHLPELLAPTERTRHTDDVRIRSIGLAARLAHDLACGWDSAVVLADVDEIAALLNLSPSTTLRLAQSI
jgi:HD-like signal output (HDOD) protein